MVDWLMWPGTDSVADSTTSRQELYEFEHVIPGSLTQRGPADVPGVSNYVLTIEDEAHPGVCLALSFCKQRGRHPRTIAQVK